LGLETSVDDCVRDFLGLGMPTTLRLVAERLGRPVPQAWVDDLDAAVRRAFLAELTPVPGIVRALDAITLPTCVASSGSHDKMSFTLGHTGLYDRFAGRIFSSDQVSRGKPAPDLFLFAAGAMDVAPEQCVVIEDSPVGVAAARAAGMRALGFAATTPPERLKDADVVFASMDALPRLLMD
jgi:HAD superfamily hydrolase (TIGR01509 family)